MSKVVTVLDEDKDLQIKRRTTPMQNFDEPFHLISCRYKNGRAARTLRTAAGLG